MTAGISVVLFDLGGTLIYFDGHWPEVFNEADRELHRRLREAGLALDEKPFTAALRNRLEAYYAERESEFIEYTTQYILRDLLRDWGHPDVSDETLRPALDAMYAVSQAHWHAEIDASPTLDTLQREGYHLGLISNAGDDADVQALVDKAGIRRYFDIILTSAAQGIRKPNPRIFHQALAHWNAAPHQAVMVGDTLGADILGAQNAGVLGIWISRRADTPDNHAHLETIRPDAVIESLAELPQLLLDLSQNGREGVNSRLARSSGME